MLHKHTQSCLLPVSAKRSVLVHLWVVNIKLFSLVHQHGSLCARKECQPCQGGFRGPGGVCPTGSGAGCHGKGNEKRKEGQEWIKWKCEWEWAKLSFKVAIFVLECCAGRSISISAFSYDSLSCLTSVDCHVKGLILASLRQPNMPFAHSYPEVCNFCTEEVAGEPDFPVYGEWTDISKEFESSRHQSVFCSVPGEDWVYPACLSEWVVIT